MIKNKLALLAIFVGTLSACGGRSALRSSSDASDSVDGGFTADGKADAKNDGPSDNGGTADVPGNGDLPGSTDIVVTPDLPGNPDGVRFSDVADAATDTLLRDVPGQETAGPDTRTTDTPRADIPFTTDVRDGSAADVVRDGRGDLPGDTAPSLASIEVTPPSPTIVVGFPYTGLIVTAVYSDGTTTDVTAAATYASGDTTVVQVTGHTLNGQKAGSATVTVTYQTKTATVPVVVSGSPLVSISIEGVAPVSVGQYILVSATGVFADGSKQDISTQASWLSSDTTLATAALDTTSAKEKVTGLGAGTISLTATLQGITGKTSITVTAATISRIDITPTQPILQSGVSQQFHATATYSDGTTGDVTQQAKWASSNSGVATVVASSTGVIVRAVAAGTTNITATVGTITGTTAVTVTSPTLQSIVLSPPTWSPNVGGIQAFTATGTFSDNTTADLTLSATWSSTNGTVAMVSNAAGQKGQATALTKGTAQIQATLAGVTGTAAVTVSASPLISITVTPNPLFLVLGVKGNLVATGKYENGTTQILTAQVAWTVSDPTIASVSNDPATAGQVTGTLTGTTSVVATFAGVAGKTVVTVAQATLKSIAVVPATASVTAGVSQQFTATGTYDNGATPDITTQVTWTSSDIGVAQVSNAAGSSGLATGLVAGKATITASMSSVAGSATLTVGAPLLSSLMIAPTSASIQVGSTQTFTVTAVYQNGTTAPVDGTWASSNTAVATINANAAGRRAVATAVAAGTTNITVTFQGLTATASLTVTTVPKLVGLTITPADPASIVVGATQQFQANAVLSDGSTSVVTGNASWTSSDAKIASVSDGGGGRIPFGKGLATGIGAGTTNITATYNGFTATVALTVRNPAPVALLVTPTDPSIRVNGTQQFVASVEMDDGTTQTVTNTASWTTSSGAVASITNGGGPGGPGGPGGGGRGLATGVSAGKVTVTATYSGMTASTTLTVSAATPTTLVVTPGTPSIQVGQTQTFVATLVYSDSTTAIVTAQATWSSSAAAVATITTSGGGGPGGPGGPGGGGTATGISAGSTTITATSNGLSGTATLTVTDPVLDSVQVTTINPDIPVGATTQFTATAVFKDNSTRNVTALATWSSSSTAVAVVANSGATIGRASALAAGSATISATYQGLTGTSPLKVASGVQSVAVTPANPTTVIGLPVTFVATALLTDNATLVVTDNASWISSDATLATVAASGLATPVKAGSPTITATYLGTSGTSTLTVSSATLSSIDISPIVLSLTVGGNRQFAATGTYSDTTTHDLTGVVTWISSASTVAAVSNANGSRGLATALAGGSTTVTAVFQNITSQGVTVTVTP